MYAKAQHVAMICKFSIITLTVGRRHRDCEDWRKVLNILYSTFRMIPFVADGRMNSMNVNDEEDRAFIIVNYLRKIWYEYLDECVLDLV